MENEVEIMTNEEKILELLETQHKEISAINSKLITMDAKLSPMQREIGKINATLEDRVFPQFEALAEGQKAFLETLAPKNRVEALENEVSFPK